MDRNLYIYHIGSVVAASRMCFFVAPFSFFFFLLVFLGFFVVLFFCCCIPCFYVPRCFSAIYVCFLQFDLILSVLFGFCRMFPALQRSLPSLRLRSSFDRFSSLITGICYVCQFTSISSFHGFATSLRICFSDILSIPSLHDSSSCGWVFLLFPVSLVVAAQFAGEECALTI